MPRQPKKESLYSQMMSDRIVTKGIKKKQEREEVSETVMDEKTSRKILEMVHEQQMEEQPVEQVVDSDNDSFNNSSDDEFDEEFIDEQDYAMEKPQPLPLSKAPIDSNLNPKVVEVYTKVGLLLSRYRSGPMPKTFKILPTLRDWEEILYVTNPDEWTPHAMYQATRIFTSNLKQKQAQRFFSVFLLERVRRDIYEHKKLNYHLYMAIKKALYKPAAFFKGFLLPFCESNPSLKETAIVASVLVKVSVPMLHSAAALLKIAEMKYSGPNSLFIRVLLDKKYALPFKVVDALVFHFIQFRDDPMVMPILWHQSLLVFCQRYKEDVTPEQKSALLDLVRHKYHEHITPEIQRELAHSVCRDEVQMAE